MLPVSVIIFIACSVALLIKFLQTLVRVVKHGGSIFGIARPSVWWVVLAKVLIFLPYAWALGYILYPGLPVLFTHRVMSIAGMLVLIDATLLLLLSLDALGSSTRIGLPEKDHTSLQIEGIYRFTRNPMYLGLILLSSGSLLLAPTWFGIISLAAGSLMHHYIILEEEKYLRNRFGKDYLEYQQNTPRYLSFRIFKKHQTP